VLSLADQPDAASAAPISRAEGRHRSPYIMPGFLLAKKAAERLFEAQPDVEGWC
jgi:rhamnose utilization protein RhaD (predicted bifunctional aldolase and dehydrogenase)